MIYRKVHTSLSQLYGLVWQGFLVVLILGSTVEWVQAHSSFNPSGLAIYEKSRRATWVSDTVGIQQLDPLEVQASSLERDLWTTGQYSNLVTKKWMELQNYAHVGDLAQAFSSAYVQTNGPGSLALLAQRGLSSSRTQLIWRGFGLNHPMLGLTDLSLLNSNLFDGVVFTPGLGNSRYGYSGAGTVHLLQDSNGDQWDRIQYTIGSFGTRTWSVGLGNTSGSTRWELRFHDANAMNDFEYQKKVFDPILKTIVQKNFKREHNRTNQQALMMMLSYELSSRWNYESSLWLYQQDNQIPGSILAPSPNASQNDGFIRWIQNLSGGDSNQWELSHFFQSQRLDYKDLDKELKSNSTIQSHIVRLNHRTSRSGSLLLQSRVEGGYFNVQSSDYISVKERYYAAHYQRVLLSLDEGYQLRLEAKQQWQTDEDWHWTASAGMEYNPISSVVLFLQAGKQTVTPTFNDLYWPVYGNPNLRPEDIWTMEGGIKWNLFEVPLGAAVWDVNTHLGYYFNHVNEGIRWVPNGQGHSSPVNIESLQSEGLEWNLDLAVGFGEWSWLMKSGIYQTKAHIDEPRYENDPALGKQLRYTPEWQFKHHGRLAFKQWGWVLAHEHVGPRYSSADHSSPFDPLESYGVWNSSISWAPKTDRREVLLQLEVKNIQDQKYEQVLHYPMPGRHIYFKIQLKHLQPEKK